MRDPVTLTTNPPAPHAVVARAVMLCGPADRLPGEPSAAETKLARKNSLGLEFALRYPEAAGLIADEKARQSAFDLVMAETSEMLANGGIPHIYIKFRKLYQYYDSNVDVVVRGRDWQRAVSMLELAGYRGHVMFKEPDKIMFSRPGSKVSVHLHPGVTWNGVPYFEEGDLWANTFPSRSGAWLEMNDDYDYLINIAHNVFENYEVSLGDILYFREFLRRGAPDARELERIAAVNGWRQGFRWLDSQVRGLVNAWDAAERTNQVPPALLAYPYRISAPALASAFVERIARNVRWRRIRPALREAYAYPAFYALKLRHDLPFLSR